MSGTTRLASLSIALTVIAAATQAQDCAPVWNETRPPTPMGGALLAVENENGPGLLYGDDRRIALLQDDVFTTQATTNSLVLRFRKLILNGVPHYYAFTLARNYRLNGQTWEALSLSGGGSDAEVFDDGGGSLVYLTTFNRVYRLGSTTTTIGSLQPGVCGSSALAVWDDGSGEKLYVGGYFRQVSGVPANGVAAWDGQSWSAVGSGFQTFTDPFGCGAGVQNLVVYDDGSGERLYAGGSFDRADGQPAHLVARWDGVSWSAVGSGSGTGGTVVRLTPLDFGGVRRLWATGSFYLINGISANGLAAWDGSQWTVPATGLVVQADQIFSVIDVVPSPTEPADALYVSGERLRTSNGIESATGLLRYGCVCGDADGSGEVDLADVAVVLAHFGDVNVAGDAPGNLDHDRNVDLADLAIVLSQFGSSCD